MEQTLGISDTIRLYLRYNRHENGQKPWKGTQERVKKYYSIHYLTGQNRGLSGLKKNWLVIRTGNLLSVIRELKNHNKVHDDDWEKTETRTPVSAGKRKLKQSVSRSMTTALNVNTNIKL